MAKSKPNHRLTFFRITEKTAVKGSHRIGEWCWRFRSPNGNITATGGESYSRLSDCRKGWTSHATAIITGRYDSEFIDKGKRLR